MGNAHRGRRSHLLVAMASAPIIGLRWWGIRGDGAWVVQTKSERASARPLQVSHTSDLARARIGYWVGHSVSDEIRSRLDAFMQMYPGVSVKGDRPSWGSSHPNGALMVASGVLDLFVLIGGGQWDNAAPAVIVEEAGSRFTDMTGEPRIANDVGIFSNGVLHEAALQMIGE